MPTPSFLQHPLKLSLLVLGWHALLYLLFLSGALPKAFSYLGIPWGATTPMQFVGVILGILILELPLITALAWTYLRHRPWRSTKGVIGLLALSIFTGCIGLAVFGPSLMLAAEGRFNWLTTREDASPDSRFLIIIQKKFAFPAAEFIDPPTLVSMKLYHFSEKSKPIAEKLVLLLEDSDFNYPDLKWETSGVMVSNFDTHSNRSLFLKY